MTNKLSHLVRFFIKNNMGDCLMILKESMDKSGFEELLKEIYPSESDGFISSLSKSMEENFSYIKDIGQFRSEFGDSPSKSDLFSKIKEKKQELSYEKKSFTSKIDAEIANMDVDKLSKFYYDAGADSSAAERIKQIVGYIDSVRSSGERFDISSFNTIEELESYFESEIEDKSYLDIDSPIVRSSVYNLGSKGDNFDVVYEDDNFKVIYPKSFSASVYWGSGTSWCVASMDDNMFYAHTILNDKPSMHFFIISKNSEGSDIFRKVGMTFSASHNGTFLGESETPGSFINADNISLDFEKFKSYVKEKGSDYFKIYKAILDFARTNAPKVIDNVRNSSTKRELIMSLSNQNAGSAYSAERIRRLVDLNILEEEDLGKIKSAYDVRFETKVKSIFDEIERAERFQSIASAYSSFSASGRLDQMSEYNFEKYIDMAYENSDHIGVLCTKLICSAEYDHELFLKIKSKVKDPEKELNIISAIAGIWKGDFKIGRTMFGFLKRCEGWMSHFGHSIMDIADYDVKILPFTMKNDVRHEVGSITGDCLLRLIFNDKDYAYDEEYDEDVIVRAAEPEFRILVS